MRTRAFVLVLVSLLMPALPAVAAAPAAGYDRNGFDPALLDTAQPLAARQALFTRLVKFADSAQVRAQELAGTLYWQGDKIAGSPVARNLAQARILLANAAVRGSRHAMAKLAELELESGRLEQAMIWAQLYTHYLNPTLSARAEHGRNFGYASDLIGRITAAGGAIGEDTAKNVNAIAARYNDAIRAGMDALREERRNGDPHLVQPPSGLRPTGKDSLISGVASFMVAFDAAGNPVRTWLLASTPTAEIATMVRPWLDGARANPVDAGRGERYLEVSIRLNGTKERILRPHR